MNVLVTAGNTQAPIDRVRCITNIFTGRTGATIAAEAHRRGHAVTLLTSHPETAPADVRCIAYRTFDDLHTLLTEHVTSGRYGAVIHSAAVSDYLVTGVYGGEFPALVDRAAAKVRSDEPDLWLRLARAPKLVDRIRDPWGFRGVLVKFKLEVDVSEPQLLDVAERSRRQSGADWMVANTLDGAAAWAYLGSADGYTRVARAELAPRLLDAIEKGADHG
jgi:phosphopantothenate-cysteine ligase/phosphopantothenoylcysteine decarboxylase/phosphopantothenate--cysteine ligase